MTRGHRSSEHRRGKRFGRERDASYEGDPFRKLARRVENGCGYKEGGRKESVLKHRNSGSGIGLEGGGDS